VRVDNLKLIWLELLNEPNTSKNDCRYVVHVVEECNNNKAQDEEDEEGEGGA